MHSSTYRSLYESYSRVKSWKMLLNLASSLAIASTERPSAGKWVEVLKYCIEATMYLTRKDKWKLKFE
jgi:hypothetical protein